MGYPHHHVQSAATMAGSPIEPKFPPISEDYAHNGYGVAAMSHQASDYMQQHHHHHHHGGHQQSSAANGQQTNGGGSGGYAPYGHQSISGHFYHHHHGYGGAQMPHASANTGYANGGGGQGGGGGGSAGGGGYYGGYYGATAGHQIMDLPVQYPAMEPTNTALGLHELGKKMYTFVGKIYLKCVLFVVKVLLLVVYN